MDVKEKDAAASTRQKSFLDNFLTCRRVLNIMVFLGFMVNYMLRVNLNFAIVDMVLQPDDHSDIISTTPFSILSSSSTPNQTRTIRSLSNAQLAALVEDDDDDSQIDSNFRNKNFAGTNGAAPKQSPATKNKPATTSFSQAAGVQNFQTVSNNNFSGGLQSFSSNSGSGSQPKGFQSFSSSSAGNQPAGFQTFSSSSGGNQGGGFQSSGSSFAATQTTGFQSSSSGSQSSGSGLTTGSQQSNEPIVHQTKVDNQFQAAPGGAQIDQIQSSNKPDQKVGLAANSLNDDILNEESHILYGENADKPAPEVRNAELENYKDASLTTVVPKPSTNANTNTNTNTNKKKRHQKPGVQRFAWDEAAQNVLISSFFWGYICTELPGGRLAEVIGARKVFGYATLLASVVTLLTPMFAKIHFLLVVIVRILLGLFLGPTWPSILPLASKWIPMNERGKFLSNMMGSTLGAGFTLPICGYIIDALSWEYVFYITGLLGFIWSVCWFLVVFETPADHPRITPEERWYIESNLGLKPAKSSTGKTYSAEEKQVSQGLMVNPGDESCLSDNEHKSSDECRNYSTFARNGDVNNTNSDTKGASRDQKSSNGDSLQKSTSNVTDKKSTPGTNSQNTDLSASKKQSGHANAPWLRIMTSIPVWAFVLTHGASVFGYNTITNQLPTFMDKILKYEIKQNGILSSFPYIGKYVMALVGGTVADKLLRSETFTKNFVRKLLTTIGVLIPGCLMILQIFVGNEKAFSIFVFTAALTANGVVVGGYLGNSLDIAPNFSGTVFGLGNMFSGLSGAVSALLVGYLTEHNQTFGQWQKVFLIVAITYITGALIFLVFGSTDVQSWNHYPEQNTNKKNEVKNTKDKELEFLEMINTQSS